MGCAADNIARPAENIADDTFQTRVFSLHAVRLSFVELADDFNAGLL